MGDSILVNPSAILICDAEPGRKARHTISIQVTYTQAAEQQAHDIIVVTVDDGTSISVPCKAEPPRPKVAVMRGDGDFGRVAEGANPQRTLTVANLGTLTAMVYARCDPNLQSVVVSPAQFELGPHGSASAQKVVTLELRDAPPGAIAGHLSFATEGTDSSVPVVVAAHVIPTMFELLDENGGAITQLDFGELYLGDKRTITLNLLNLGSAPARFSALSGTLQDFAEEDDRTAEKGSAEEPLTSFIKAARLRAQALNNTADRPFDIEPCEGALMPHSQTQLRISFRPQQDRQQRGFATTYKPTERQFSFCGQIRLNGGAEEIKFSMAGRGLEPDVALEPVALNFGTLLTYAHGECLVTLHNRGVHLPITFDLSLPAYFHCKPSAGQILPGGSCPMILQYSPKALGHHGGKGSINIQGTCGGHVATLPLPVAGTADNVGCKPHRTRGKAALPEDFCTPPNFVYEAAIRKPARHFKRPALWEIPDLQQRLEGLSTATAGETLTLAELKKSTAHRAYYNNVLKEQRQAREAAKKCAGSAEVDGTDMDMQPYRGLKEGRLPRPSTLHPVIIEDVAKGARPRNRPEIPADLLTSTPIFKARPNTPEEQQECSSVLDAQAISSLAVGPRQLDFGRVCVGSANIRYLAVSNPTARNVHVVICALSTKCLTTSEHMSQVIPQGRTAKFPLCLVPTASGPILEAVEYVINGCHFFAVEVKAHALLATLELSTDRLHFEFAVDNWQPYVEEVLVVSNAQPFETKFKVQLADEKGGVWSASPMEGLLQANSSQEVVVRWAPGSGAAAGEFKADLWVEAGGEGGERRRVTLSASLLEGKLVFSEKALDFSSVAVGTPHCARLELRNPSTNDALFQVSTNESVRCMPERGQVPAGSTFELEVTFCLGEPQTLTTRLDLEVRGGKALRLPITAQVLVPSVEISESSFDFAEGVHVGCVARLPFTLANATSVPATLRVDLTPHKEFWLELPRDSWDPQECDAPPLTKVGWRASIGSCRSSRRARLLEAGDDSKREGGLYQVKLGGSKTLKLILMFKPLNPGSHSFNIAAELIGYGIALAGARVSRGVTATALAPYLMASCTAFDFGQQIVARGNRTAPPNSLEFQFVNNSSKELSFACGPASIEGAEGCRGVFSLKQKSGHLKPGVAVNMCVQYLPKDERHYEAVIPVFVDNDRSKAYLELEVRGAGQFPRLTFSVRECILPQVPLKVQARFALELVNAGYDNADIKVRLPADQQHVPLTVDFPEGSLIGVARERLPIVLTFSSQKPCSFTANVEFVDEEGFSYCLPVSASADASLLMLTPFLQANKGELAWKKSAAGVLSMDPGLDYELPETGLLSVGPTTSSPAAAKLLHAATFKGPFPSLPVALAAGRGRFAVEILESFSRKSIPGKVVNFAHNRKEAAGQALTQAEALITFLRGHGALLGGLKPELLLELEDFRLIIAKREVNVGDVPDSTLDAWYEIEDNFETLSFKAWNSFILQAIKTFVLGKVTARSLRTALGSDNAEAKLPSDAILQSSNVYSPAELVLLSWLSFHYKKVFPALYTPISNFDTDLRSGLVLYSVLLSHWQWGDALRHMGKVRAPAQHQDDMRENCSMVIKMMEALRLPFPMQVEEIVQGDAAELLILGLYLFNELPSLEPRSTITFTGNLGEAQTRRVEINNPSSRGICYEARLDGHQDFTLPNAILRVEPKATAELIIQCKPTTTNPQVGRLVLNSRKEGSCGPGAPFVFSLRSDADARGPLKRISVEAPVYSFLETECRIANPFPEDCDFSVTLVHQPADALEAGNNMRDDAQHPGITSRPGNRGASKRNGRRPVADADTPKLFPDAFGVDQLRIRVKSGAEEVLRVAFLPFSMGLHHCCLVFEDATCGRFIYELVGEAQLPLPSRPITFQVGLESGQQRDIPLPWMNPQIETARRTFLERHPLARSKDQAQLATQELPQVPLTFTAEASERLEVVPSLVIAPGPAAPLPADSKGLDKAAPGRPAASNQLRITFRPTGPGSHRARILLMSPNDVRMLDVEYNAQAGGQAATLEIACPARQTLLQEVPVINESTSPLVVVADCKGDAFSGPRELTVPAGQVATYPLLFQPAVAGTCAGTLELHIPATGERNVYTLVGNAGEPLAEGHFTMACRARQPALHKLMVPNVLRDGKAAAKYRVMTDLHCVGGEVSLMVEPGGSAPYSVQVCGGQAGIMKGTITFIADSGEYVWYTIEVSIENAAPVAELSVAGTVREAVEIEVLLVNSLDKPAKFEVSYTPDSLLGVSSCSIEPKKQQPFTFYFAPLLAGTSNGRVTFSHPQLGNFTYIVKMAATEAPPIDLPLLSAPLGSKARHIIDLQNPLDGEVLLEAHSSNPHAFIVQPSSLILPALGSAAVILEYIPSALGVLETSDIILQHEQAGKWQYSCKGEGTPPGQSEPTVLTAVVGEDGNGHIAWNNPFPDNVHVDVTLLEGSAGGTAGTSPERLKSSQGDDAVFHTLLKKSAGLAVPGRGLLTVPISYQPKYLVESEAELLVTVQRDSDPEALVWRYPIRGTPEATSGGEDFKVTCRARRRVQEFLNLTLNGLQQVDAQDVFTHELILPPNKANALQNAVTITEKQTSISDPSQPLLFILTFAPQKALSARVELVVTRQGGGGRWRFHIQLEATQPESDGCIRLAAAPGESAVAPLRIFSPTDAPMPFTARFSHDSSMHFDVTPATGILQVELPHAQNLAGAQTTEGITATEPALWVKYTAAGHKDAGKAPSARLIVQTDEASWSWLVYGVQPTYNPPNKDLLQSHIHNRR